MKKLTSLLYPVTICLIAWHVAAYAAPAWQTVHRQSPDSAGTSLYPSIRYGHACHAYKGQLLTTHGYYYDRDRAAGAWQSDTWVMDAADGSYAWRRLSSPLPQAEAYGAYFKGRAPRAPCGRFGHVSVLLGDALLLYGGSDGGYSRTNRDDYRPGNDFDELWRLDLTNLTWSLLRPAGGKGPGKRHMAGAAAVQGKLVLYGGMGPDRGDVWSYSPAENRWELLAEASPSERGGPGGRCGHGMIPWSTGQAYGLVMYGGQEKLPNGSYVVRNDAWFFDMAARSWRKLRSDDADGAAAPPGHFYQAVMSTTLTLPPSAVAAAAAGAAGAARRAKSCKSAAAAGGAGGTGGESGGGPAAAAAAATAAAGDAAVRIRVGVVAGGSATTPGLTCSKQAWAFTIDCAATRITWARLPDLPVALYDTRGAAVGGAAYVFGGHLCHLDHPPRPPYPYYYTNEALRLDLGLGLDSDLGLNSNSDSDSNLGRGVAALLRGGVGAGDGDGDGAAACAVGGGGVAAVRGGGSVGGRQEAGGEDLEAVEMEGVRNDEL